MRAAKYTTIRKVCGAGYFYYRKVGPLCNEPREYRVLR